LGSRKAHHAARRLLDRSSILRAAAAGSDRECKDREDHG
jgi:hypothetical protein